MRRLTPALASFALLCTAPLAALADPTVGTSQKLCWLVGETVPKMSSQPNLQFYGTDLGYSYRRGTNIEILFGDSWRDEAANPIDPGSKRDDAFGTISLTQYPDGQSVENACGGAQPAFVTFGQNPAPNQNTTASQNPGVPMELGKTPVAAFITGTAASAQEFAIFSTAKPQGCRTSSDCRNGMVCDQGLGFAFNTYDDPNGVTIACRDNTFGCLNDTMSGLFGLPIPFTGFCTDPTSSVATPDDNGRILSTAWRHRVGVRQANRRDFKVSNAQEWHTNRFINVTATPVNDFAEARAGNLNDYLPPDGVTNTSREKVLLWGRPNYAGVSALGREARLYFAYADRPVADANGNFNWSLHYYTGTSGGVPTFSTTERSAAQLVLGANTSESSDYIGQMTIKYFPELAGGGRSGRWVMLYSGRESTLPRLTLPFCGYLELLVGWDCVFVNQGNGAVKMRWADDPWGPWSPAQPVVVVGYPDDVSITPNQYGIGGVLSHPTCRDTAAGCAPVTTNSSYDPNEYGVLYGPNIIEEWKTATASGVDVIWNVSTWDPQSVVLFKTSISK